MPLARYKPSEVRLQTGNGVAQQAQAQVYNSLSEKLNQWSGVFQADLEEQAINQATEQAYKDDLEGKEYHKENVYTVYGKAYNNARTASYAAKTELDLTQKSNEFAITYKNDANGYANAMRGYINGINKEMPDPALKASISIYGEKLVSNQSSEIAKVQLKEQKETQLAIYEQFKDNKTAEITKALIKGDKKTADLLRSQLDEYTTTLMENDVLSDEKFIEDFGKGQYQINRGVLEGKIQSLIDSQQFEQAEALEQEFNKEIPKGYTLEQYRTTKSALRTLIAGGRKEQRAKAKELKEFANDKFDEVNAVLKDGKTPKILPTQSDVANASPSKVNEYNLLVKVNEVIDEYRDLPFQEQQKKVNEYLKSEEATKLDVEVRKRLEDIVSNRRTKWTNDPITQGEVENLYKPVDVTYGDKDFINNLKIRFKQSKINQNEAGEIAWKLLREDEANTLEKILNSNDATIEVKQQLIADITSAGKDVAKQVFNQLSKKNLKDFTFAGELSLRGNTNAAQISLLGSKSDIQLEEGTKADVQGKIGNAFRTLSPDDYNANKNGIINYIKGKKALGEDVSVDDAIEQTIGKVVKYNNQDTLLPYNVTETDFESWLDNISIPDRPNLQEGLRDMTDMFASGSYQMHYQGNGEYYIYNSNDGAGYYERASNDPKSEDYNKPYILRWEDK